MRHGPLALILPLLAACASDPPVEWPSPLPEGQAIEFPVELWDLGIEGETVLMVRVSAVGDVDTLFVERSSGYAEFDSAAVTAIRSRRFKPGRRGDQRVDMWIRLPVRFDRAGETAIGAAPDTGETPETQP